MKTIHRSIVAIFFLTFSFNAIAASNDSGWPEVSGVQWELKGNRLHINWNANSDDSGIYYLVEKSTDGKKFIQEGLVLGGFNQSNQFTFAYRMQHQSGYQYRITQVNKEGQSRLLDLKSF